MYESCLIFFIPLLVLFSVSVLAQAEQRERQRKRERERAKERSEGGPPRETEREWRSGVSAEWRGSGERREEAEAQRARAKEQQKQKESKKELKEDKSQKRRDQSGVPKGGRPHTLEAAHTCLTSSSTRPPPHRQRTLSTRSKSIERGRNSADLFLLLRAAAAALSLPLRAHPASEAHSWSTAA